MTCEDGWFLPVIFERHRIATIASIAASLDHSQDDIMHSLHLMIVIAESPSAACKYVENVMWGWRGSGNFCGVVDCVSENDEPYCADSTMWKDWAKTKNGP